jgi:uncharacterized protein
MLLFKTTIGPSPIHGLGIIAAERIEKGAALWRFTPGFDMRFTPEQVSALPAVMRDYLVLYSFSSRRPGMRVLPADNGRYFNHSRTPTALSADEEGEEEVVTRALRDILPGEEITDDYHTFENDFKEW